MARSRYNSAPLAVLRSASRYPKVLDLAEKIGVTQSTLSNIERGHKMAGDDTLRALAKFLAVRFETVKAMHLQAVLDRMREQKKTIEAELNGIRKRSA